ncbi:MAG: hypothetical protein ACRD0J_06280 [Acidimicrobiales bacterium]
MILALVALFVVLFVVLPLAGLALWALVSTAIVGLIIGAVARLIIPGRQAIGLLATLLLGLVGSIVGSFIGHLILLSHPLTILLEIGVAIAAVATYSRWGQGGARRRSLGGGRRPSRLGRAGH